NNYEEVWICSVRKLCWLCFRLACLSHEGTLFVPYPLPINHTVLTLIKWTVGDWPNITSVYPWLGWKPNMIFRDPRNFSRDTNTSMVQKNVVFRLRNLSNPFFIPQLCFHSPVTEHTRYHLGHTSGCNITLKTFSPSPFLVLYNITALLALTPSDYGYGCPTDMVWTCGQHSYLYLPAQWAGTCHLSYLIPAVSKLTISPLMSPPHTRVKRDRISGGHEFAISIIPLYGPARLAWYIEELSVELENLTASVEQGFDTLTSEMKAFRTISLQNRAALDLLLPEKGGVCHLTGDQCCTYVPDITANMSDVHNQLDHLRRVLHEENTAYSTTGWDFWGWLLSGGWRALLVKTQTSTFWTHHPCTYSKCPCAFKTWNALIVHQSRMHSTQVSQPLHTLLPGFSPTAGLVA
uniref:C2H2-type domain-containing protein n=1 Tax=Sphaeramia orbicularis TaxID=375764 RepID=A0A673C5P2_9TELE